VETEHSRPAFKQAFRMSPAQVELLQRTLKDLV
jgi:hypothetical protein